MLIKFNQLIEHFKPEITGILHVGAHDCEEKSEYNRFNISDDNIFWVDAMSGKIDSNKQKYGQHLNIYHGVIDDEDDKTVNFHITNNGESSSILEFGSHETHHPHVKVVSTQEMKTTRLDTLIERHQIPIEKLNFLNLDIQGVELRALKSMEKHLQHVRYIYTEVNIEQVYKDCDQMPDIDEYLSKFGFKRAATNILSQYGWGDAFYIKG
jgi:FkbM family methyltransferase